MNAEDRSQAHFVEFALKSHIPNRKSVVLSLFDILDTEVKPAVVVTILCVGHSVSTHIDIVLIVVFFGPLAIVHIAAVEGA